MLGKRQSHVAITVAVDTVHVIDTRQLFNVTDDGARSIPEKRTTHVAQTCIITDDIDSARNVAIDDDFASTSTVIDDVLPLRGIEYCR